MDDESDDDEDWYDDDSELDDEETGPCPECGAELSSIAEACPACGYWLSEADRRAMWSGHSKPVWLRVTAIVVLIAFVMSLLGIAAALL